MVPVYISISIYSIHLYTRYATYRKRFPLSLANNFPNSQTSNNDRLLLLLPILTPTPILRVNAKLHKDDHVLHHRPETADQPRCVRPQVVSLEGVGYDAGAVGEVAGEGEDEEEERESCRDGHGWLLS